MALADRVADRLARRSDPVTLEEFGYLLGQSRGGLSKSKAGVMVGEKRAQGISAWWRGVRYLSETMASLPVHSYVDRLGTRTRQTNPAWVDRPDSGLPWFTLIECSMMAELHRGNCYGFKLRDQRGVVTGVRPLHPDRVHLGQTSLGTKVFQLDGRTDVAYTSREILHIPALSSDGVIGIDPIRAHGETLGTIAAGDEYAGRFFGQGDHTRAYLSIPQEINQKQADALYAVWERFHQGMQNAHGFGVIGNGGEYKTVGLDPQQTQLLESRRFGVTEVARILGVVPHKLYDLERSTFSNIEHQAIEAIMDGIRPWAVRFEAYINSDPDLVPRGTFIEFQLEGMLRGDTESRYKAHQSAIDAGWMMPSTAARIENQPAPAELDYYRFPLNTALIRPGIGIETPGQQANGDMTLEQFALAVQKLYLGVGVVVSDEEARDRLGLKGALPAKTGGDS